MVRVVGRAAVAAEPGAPAPSEVVAIAVEASLARGPVDEGRTGPTPPVVVEGVVQKVLLLEGAKDGPVVRRPDAGPGPLSVADIGPF